MLNHDELWNKITNICFFIMKEMLFQKYCDASNDLEWCNLQLFSTFCASCCVKIKTGMPINNKAMIMLMLT